MSFWGITVYFNPSKYNKRFENYKAFRKSSKAQRLKLLTVELALNDEPFVLQKSDSDILIQVRSNSVMWHKERLINIGFDNLPDDCKKVAWLDCDLIFLNKDWVRETSSLLNKYDLVQPFSSVFQTNQKLKVINESYGFGYCCKKNIGGKTDKDFSKHATWGYGWAAKYDLIKNMGGLYDKNIIGGGDNIVKLSFGFCEIRKELFSEEHLKDITNYFNKNKDNHHITRGKITCTSGNAKHLWHGDRKNRGYGERDIILIEENYDPIKDLTLNEYNCFEFTEKNGKLENKIKSYFDSRKEDG
jgi:hypothetical protein